MSQNGNLQIDNIKIKQEIIEEVKRLFKEGKTYKQISNEIGISKSYFYQLVDECKRNGTWFTDDELQEINIVKREEVSRKKREKYIAQIEKNAGKIEQIKSLTREGKTHEQIADELGISIYDVPNLINQSKYLGTWFTDDEMKEINEIKYQKRTEKRVKRQKEKQIEKETKQIENDNVCRELQEKIELIKEMYVKGKTKQEIAKELGVDLVNINTVVKRNKENGNWFTEEEIKKIEQNRTVNKKTEKIKFLEEHFLQEERNQIEKIKEKYGEGKNLKQISAELGIDYGKVKYLIRKGKVLEIWFTDNELEDIQRKIEKDREEHSKAEESKKKEQKTSQIQQVKYLYKEGNTQRQIAEKLGISQSSVSNIIKKCKEEGGWLTENEIKIIEFEREEKKQQDAQDKANRIKALFAQGKSDSEISYEIGKSISYVKIMIKQLISDDNWFSEEELAEINKLKKQNNDSNIRVKKQRELGTDRFIKDIITLYKSGKSLLEISQIMGCSATHIADLRKKSIQAGTWVSEEEDAELRKKVRYRSHKKDKDKTSNEKRKTLEKTEIRRNKLEQQNMHENKSSENLKQEQRIIAELRKIRDIKQPVFGNYMSSFKFIRSAAKQEDKKEYNGEENVTIKGRQAFIESVLKLHSLGLEGITENDFKMISDSFFMHPELANKEILKLIVSNSIKKKGWNSALETVYELADSLEDTKYYEALIDYGDWIKRKSYLPQIKLLKEQGWNNSQIGKRFRLSSAEIMILLDNDKNKVDVDYEFN